jgi:hypothetical protein
VACGAARVHLDTDISAYSRQIGVGSGLPVAPCWIIAAGNDDLPDARKLIADGGDGVEKLSGDKQDFGLGVIDNERDLRPSQAPVDRYEHRIRLGSAEPDLEKAVVIFVEKRDTALRTKAGGNQSIRLVSRSANVSAIDYEPIG